MRRVPVVAALLFASGVCALAYQIGWLRELRLVFGASTAATAVVLAVFMGGLGVGGLLFGPRADRSANPVRLYALLELAVAAMALASPYLLEAVRWLYFASGGAMALGWSGATVVRLLLSVCVLGVPTVLMGGTLPAAARAVESADDRERRRLAVLYGVNTLGAVTGAALANFILLEQLGTRATIWSAGGVNLMIGVLALFISRRWETASAVVALEEIEEPGEPAAESVSRRFVYVAACAVGMAFLVMELVWYRALAPILGGSTYTFGIILAVALSGIGGGGWLYSLRRQRPGLSLFALTCALEAGLIAVPFVLGDRLAVFAALLAPLGNTGFLGQLVGWLIVTVVVVLPASAVSGFQFPVLVGCLGTGQRDVGVHTGRTYAANTFGAIVGSLGGGFLLIPHLGLLLTWQLVVAGLVAVTVAAAVISMMQQGRRPLALAALAIVSVVVVAQLMATGPTAVWRHSPIGAGRVDLADSKINEIEAWKRWTRRQLVWEADGAEVTVGLMSANGLAFYVNGKSDGNSVGDAGTQIMSPLIGAALVERPRSALVVGLGTGCSAGWLAEVSSIERVVVAELENDVLEMARRCESINHNVLEHPKVQVEVCDGRELLLTSSDRFDVVFSEPSNPYRAGVASLYTVEYYRAAKERMTEDGVFCQFTQAYEVDTRTVRTVLASLRQVFRVVEVWESQPGDMLFVCSERPLTIDAERLRDRLAKEPFASAIANTWGTRSLEGFLARFVASDDVVREVATPAVASDWINTDNRMLVEFSFARTVGNVFGFSTFDLRLLGRQSGGSRPRVRGEVRWDEVHRAVMEQYAFAGNDVPGALAVTSRERSRMATFNASSRGELDQVLRAWQQQDEPAETLIEMAIVGEAMAEACDADCLQIQERLRARWTAVADGILVRYALRCGDLDAAAAAYASMVRELRQAPWPGRLPVVRRALRLGVDLVRADRRYGTQIIELLSQPFAVYLLDDWRQRMAFEAAAQLGDPQQMAAVVRSWEPDVPWEEEVLAERAKVYAIVEDPLAEEAAADLGRYLRAAPERVLLQ